MRSGRFWVAYGALAAAIALLVPTLLPLGGSMDAFADDLSNGTFRPFGTPPGKSALRTFSGSLGGFTGSSPGNYLPGAAEVPPSWLMDRDGTGGNVVIDAVFNPSLGAMKRLKAYDVVGADGATLSVSDARLRPAAPDALADYDQVIEGSFPVQFRSGEAIPVFSPHPKAVVNAYSTSPPVRGGVQFLRDGADTLYALAAHDGTVTLNLTFLTASRYYVFDPAPGLHARDYPSSVRPQLPPALAEDAKVVLARAGVDEGSDLGEALRTLNRYFRSFTEGEIPEPTEVESLYLALALGGHGCCRHRAFAYMVTAQSLGVPTRVVVNEAHAFVEMMLPDGRWTQVNLGGCGTYTVNNPNAYPDYFPQSNDPRGEANPTEDRPLPTVPTETNITESPSRIVKGERYFVNGTVRTPDGRGVPGARIDVFLNETKTAPGRLTGAGTTDAQGVYSIVARVPKELPARSYQLVARAVDPGGAQVRYLESWSDPEVDVFAPTRFTLPPLRAAAGFPVQLSGTLADTEGAPIAGATIRWSADNQTRPPIVTDAKGTFVAEVQFNETGPKPVVLVYDGDEHHGPANVTTSVSVETGAILLPPELPPAVRGERNTVEGRVALAGVPLGGRLVRATVTAEDSPRLVTVGQGTTDDEGRFAAELDIPLSVAPGVHQVKLESGALGLSTTAPLRVAVRPTLTLDAPHSVSHRETLVLTARLADDTGAPIANRTLRLLVDENASAMRGGTTNRSGVATFELPPQSPGARALLVRFDGDETRLEAVAGAQVRVVPPWYAGVAPWAWGAVAGGFVLFALAAWVFRDGGPGRRAAARLFARRAARWRLEIVFPQHPEGVDPAFEPGERALVRVRAADREGRAVEPRVRLLRPVGARGRAQHLEVEVVAPELGPLVVEARAAGLARLWTAPARAEVPVTTYRAMVERGFVELRRRARLEESATPGDLMRIVGARAPPAAVRDAAVLFEVADYSERAVDRAFYHRFSRARAAVESALEGAPEGT